MLNYFGCIQHKKSGPFPAAVEQDETYFGFVLPVVEEELFLVFLPPLW